MAELPTPNTASLDTIEAMSMEMIFDYAGVRLNSEKAGEAAMKLNFDFGEDGKYLVELENGVLNHTKDVQAEDAAATVTLPRAALNRIMLGEETLDQLTSSGKIQVGGDAAKLTELVSYLDNFEFWFNIVTS